MVGGSNGIMGLQEYTSAGWEQWGQGWNETWLPSELQRIEMDIPASQLSNTTVRLIFQRNTGSATGSMYCFLDNLVITQYQTEILEENNYYPLAYVITDIMMCKQELREEILNIRGKKEMMT